MSAVYLLNLEVLTRPIKTAWSAFGVVGRFAFFCHGVFSDVPLEVLYESPKIYRCMVSGRLSTSEGNFLAHLSPIALVVCQHPSSSRKAQLFLGGVEAIHAGASSEEEDESVQQHKNMASLKVGWCYLPSRCTSTKSCVSSDHK